MSFEIGPRPLTQQQLWEGQRLLDEAKRERLQEQAKRRSRPRRRPSSSPPSGQLLYDDAKNTGEAPDSLVAGFFGLVLIGLVLLWYFPIDLTTFLTILKWVGTVVVWGIGLALVLFAIGLVIGTCLLAWSLVQIGWLCLVVVWSLVEAIWSLFVRLWVWGVPKPRQQCEGAGIGGCIGSPPPA